LTERTPQVEITEEPAKKMGHCRESNKKENNGRAASIGSTPVELILTAVPEL
jgi:hypothetical protein